MQSLWTLRGAALVLLRDWKSSLALVHYESSPVGAYDEFAVTVLTFRGPRVIEMPVTSFASCEAGRALWGFPKTVESMNWRRAGRRIVFRRGREYFRFRVFSFSFPLRATAWTRQTRDGRSVRVPFAMRARVRPAFRGKQLAFLLDNFELRVFPPTTDYRPPITDN